MIKVRIESVRVSLMSQHRIAVLQEEEGDRYLPIWIGPFEAEAIAMHLRHEKVPRPLTHDLVHSLIEELNGLDHVIIHDLEQDIYLARLVFNQGPDGEYELECRPSDAIAIAVRCDCPIYVADRVMDVAAKVPDEEIPLELNGEATSSDMEGVKQTSPEDLEVFRDVVEGLDLDSLHNR